MKSISVLIIVAVLVAGFAVNGSRAGPVVQHSVAFAQCQGAAWTSGECHVLLTRIAMGVDEGPIGDNVGATYGSVDGAGAGGEIDPDRWLALVMLLLDVGKLLASNWDKLIGDTLAMAPTMPSPDGLFDPVK